MTERMWMRCWGPVSEGLPLECLQSGNGRLQLHT